MLRQFWIILFLGLFSFASANTFAVYNNPEEPTYEEEEDTGAAGGAATGGTGGGAPATRKPVSGPVTPSEQAQER